MRIHRIILLVGLVALTPVLSACADFDMDKLDIFGLNEKKKLPGDRKPVFPEGVPGVSQGIPPEYTKGYQPPPDTAQAPAEQGNAATAAEPAKQTAAVEPKPKPKRKPKPRVAAPAQDQQQPPPQQQGQTVAPWPASPAPGTVSR